MTFTLPAPVTRDQNQEKGMTAGFHRAGGSGLADPNQQPKMRFGSLFAGIGGFDLGLERAGMECAWQVEIDPFCTRVLQKHWPSVRRWDDVRTFPPAPIDDWKVDLICGGFPCQDVSHAGKGAGIEDGTRSGLWIEFARIIRTLRPRIVCVENVTGLLANGLGRVLGDLAAFGYDAEWSVLGADQFGHSHARDRVFIVADANGERCGNAPARSSALSVTPGPTSPTSRAGFYEPILCGMVHGLPNYVDRLRGLGNAVVPQVAEWIGRRILEAVAPCA